MTKLCLRAIPKPVKKGDHESYNLQYFEYWDDSDEKWKLQVSDETSDTLLSSDTLWNQRKKGMDQFERWLEKGTYDEIQLRPLCFSEFDKSVRQVDELIHKKANGMALMRQFWTGGGLLWVPHEHTRLRWKYDTTNKEMYTIFDKGTWKSSDSPNFELDVDAIQIVLKGLNLTGLKLNTKEESEFPRNLNYTVCIRCELDGIQKATSFRGAHLRQARFCGKSRLKENDLTSTICWKTHFYFPNDEIEKNIKKGVDRFKDLCLDEASFIDTAIFDFSKKDSDNPTNPNPTNPNPTNPNPTNAHPANVIQTNTNAEANYAIISSFGVRKHFSLSREMLSKHKSELVYVVDELERLRKYEAKKDNWQEIIDSWIAFSAMTFETKEATEMKNFLFEQKDSKDLIIIGTVLYSMDDEPPYGLLKRIKKHVGGTLLRNEKYYENKKTLTDAIETINSILHTKDSIETTIQNLVLGFFIFFFTIGANIISDEVQQRILIVTGLDNGDE